MLNVAWDPTPLWPVLFALAQSLPDPGFGDLAQFGLVGAILSITFWFVNRVIADYRKDNDALKADNRDLNTYLRERVVPLVESCANALRETSSSNAEVVKVLERLLYDRDRDRRG